LVGIGGAFAQLPHVALASGVNATKLYEGKGVGESDNPKSNAKALKLELFTLTFANVLVKEQHAALLKAFSLVGVSFAQQ
jgi:hypothetical protein